MYCGEDVGCIMRYREDKFENRLWRFISGGVSKFIILQVTPLYLMLDVGVQ